MTGPGEDVLAAWEAVAEASKILPALARYRQSGDVTRTCGTCGYHDGGVCLLVAAAAGDESTCDLWRPAPRHASRPEPAGGM